MKILSIVEILKKFGAKYQQNPAVVNNFITSIWLDLKFYDKRNH